MTKQPEALRLADALDAGHYLPATTAIELRRLHEEVEVLMAALSKAYGDDEETVLRAIEAERPDYDGSDEASPNHYCYGQIVHLPNGEECSACGKATGETE
jgi:hypothetical protein